MCKKIIRSKWYKLIGDVYEYYGQDMSSKNRTHTDVGWRLRSKSYNKPSTFAGIPLTNSIQDVMCPLNINQAGVYILRDLIFPNGFYIGKGKCIHDRVWKHGVKLAGTDAWNQGVKTTQEFEKYRKLREMKGFLDLTDIEVAFWFTENIDNLEDQIMGAFTSKYNQTPFCNSVDEALFESFDI